MNKVYSIIFADTAVAPLLTSNNYGIIPLSNKTALLKSVGISVRAYNNAAPYEVFTPGMLSKYIRWDVAIESVDNLFTDYIDNVNLPAKVSYNGVYVKFFENGQFQFNSFFVRNSLRLDWDFQNMDVLLSLNYEAAIVVEVEIIDI
jgi:hypothetical protein